MIDHAADLAEVFYGPDSAYPFTRKRPGFADVTVMVIMGADDRSALEDRVIATHRLGRFVASQDVRAGDLLVAQQEVPLQLAQGAALRVLEAPERVNDGMEMEALLGSGA